MAIDKTKLTASQEDYLEAIWALIWKEGFARVGDIAEWLGVSTPSVIGALKTLAKRDLVEYSPHKYVTLSDVGMELAEKMPDVSFVTTFGATPEQEEGVYENVTVTGRLPFDEAKECVEEAGVYLCTVRETFGIGTLEAMAAGVPVVGWNWGGQREILKMFPGSMVLVDPGDVEGLEKAIRVALAEGATVEAALKAVQYFDEQKIAAQYAGFLRGVYDRWQQEHKAPRTSIVVTAYNLAQYLPACLDSILAQESEDWECVIVDDASPDDSGKIAEEYGAKDRRFRIIHNAENEYLAGARNTGIAAARGRYVLPLDADDMLGPKAVGVLADALDQDRSNHIAYGGVRFVDEDGVTPTDYKVKGQEPGYSGWPMIFRYDWQVDLGRNLLPYCSMFRKNVWELAGGYRRRCRTAEDAEFWSRAASFGFRPAMVTSEDTLIYRNREDSMSRREGETDWTAWFPWHYEAILRPAGALTEEQAPVHSCDPPLIAVVIPVGPGHEELLWDALDSVEAQTFRQWECIVVNDTGAPLRQLPSWVTLLETEGERGVAACRNMALEVARAKFFLPLDADDYMQPTCLKRLLDAHMETGDPIIYSDWYDEAPDKKWSIYEARDYDARLLTQRGCVHAVTALYLRRLWQDLGGFDETLQAWEDWDFQLGAAARGACSTRVPLPLWVYRKGTGYRREENYADFEDSKNGILAKWGKFFRGDEILMACSGCSKKRAAPVPVVAHKSSPAPATQGAALFEYTGKATGRKRYRAPSGQTYVFAALPSHKQKWVLGDDVPYFAGLQGFQRIDQPQQAPEEATKDPALVAEGPPAH